MTRESSGTRESLPSQQESLLQDPPGAKAFPRPQEIGAEAIAALEESLAPLGLADRLRAIARRFARPLFTTSLGPEDQLIGWAIAHYARDIRLVTLQTGRLFPETEALIETTEKTFSLPIAQIAPERQAVEALIARDGPFGFYESRAARLACCHVRKVEPLARILQGADAWITGLRRGQSGARRAIPLVAWETMHRIVKINPLAEWTASALSAAIAKHNIPLNPLHMRGYASIGCEPCTRPIRPGEPERAGRWWWEQEDTRECGLHQAQPEVSKG